MGFFTKTNTNPAPITASGLADQLSAQLERNAQKLEARKDRALSSFRRTVLDLRHINQALTNEVTLTEQMIADCKARQEAANIAINDNNKVIEGIINIIGEVPDTCVDEDGDGDCDVHGGGAEGYEE